MKKLLSLLVLLLFLTILRGQETYTAPSCNYSDVNANPDLRDKILQLEWRLVI